MFVINGQFIWTIMCFNMVAEPSNHHGFQFFDFISSIFIQCHPTNISPQISLFILCQIPTIFLFIKFIKKMTLIGKLNLFHVHLLQSVSITLWLQILQILLDSSRPIPNQSSNFLLSDETLPLAVGLTTSQDNGSNLNHRFSLLSIPKNFQIHRRLQSLKQTPWL